MRYVQVVKEVIGDLETGLGKEIRLDEIAARHYISKYHFHRIFKAVTNLTVKGYLDKRRLTEAAKEIRRTEYSILEIALQHGYNSHEVFSRNFKKEFGISPLQYRNDSEVEIQLFPKMKIVEREFFNKNKDIIVNYTLEELDNFTLSGVCNYFNPDDLGDRLRIREVVLQFVDQYITGRQKERLFSVTNGKMEMPDQIMYFNGFEGHSVGDAKLDTLFIPKSKYAVFSYVGDMNDIYQTILDDLYRCISISDLEISSIGIEFFELYEQDYARTGNFKIYLPIC